eukprot:2123585-Rhodomonas_salina.1
MSAAQYNESLTDLLSIYGKTFKTVASLISWIKVCWKECFIEVKAKNPGSDQPEEGYEKALESLFQKRSASAVLSEDMLD